MLLYLTILIVLIGNLKAESYPFYLNTSYCANVLNGVPGGATITSSMWNSYTTPGSNCVITTDVPGSGYVPNTNYQITVTTTYTSNYNVMAVSAGTLGAGSSGHTTIGSACVHGDFAGSQVKTYSFTSPSSGSNTISIKAICSKGRFNTAYIASATIDGDELTTRSPNTEPPTKSPNTESPSASPNTESPTSFENRVTESPSISPSYNTSFTKSPTLIDLVDACASKKEKSSCENSKGIQTRFCQESRLTCQWVEQKFQIAGTLQVRISNSQSVGEIEEREVSFKDFLRVQTKDLLAPHMSEEDTPQIQPRNLKFSTKLLRYQNSANCDESPINGDANTYQFEVEFVNGRIFGQNSSAIMQLFQSNTTIEETVRYFWDQNFQNSTMEIQSVCFVPSVVSKGVCTCGGIVSNPIVDSFAKQSLSLLDHGLLFVFIFIFNIIQVNLA